MKVDEKRHHSDFKIKTCNYLRKTINTLNKDQDDFDQHFRDNNVNICEYFERSRSAQI